MVGHGGSSAGSYLADSTSPIPSHCGVFILFKPASSAPIVVTSILRVNTETCNYTKILEVKVAYSCNLASINFADF